MRGLARRLNCARCDLALMPAQAMRRIGEAKLQVIPKISRPNVRYRGRNHLLHWPLGMEVSPAIENRRIGRRCVVTRRRLHRPTTGEFREIDQFHNLNPYHRAKPAVLADLTRGNGFTGSMCRRNCAISSPFAKRGRRADRARPGCTHSRLKHLPMFASGGRRSESPATTLNVAEI